MRHLPTLLISIVLLAVPLAMIIEHAFPTAWTNRLYLPQLAPLPDYHTPFYRTGSFLPPVLRKNTTLTADHNPYLITSSTFVPPAITVTIEPGVSFFAAENSGLVIAGRLIAHGTAKLPISFQSNEQHPLNQTWLGLTAEPRAVLDLQHVSIDDASPAISCLPDSHVAISQTQLRRGSLGVFQSQTPCLLDHSFINGPTIGLASVNTAPAITNTLIAARRQDFLTVASSPPGTD